MTRYLLPFCAVVIVAGSLVTHVNAQSAAVVQAIDGHIVGASVYYGVLERLPQK